MRVCHLFSGLGGFACGAVEAGANVVLAVDNDPAPLKLLASNSPGTTTVVATLAKDEVSLPPAAPDLHVHFSSPCTEPMVRGEKTASAANGSSSLGMLRWSIEFVMERGDYSWSLEHVVTRAARDMLRELQAAHPTRIAFCKIDSVDFGSPQSRIRLVAGPPELVRMLLGIPRSKRVSVRDAFERQSKVPTALFLKNQTRGKDGAPTMRSIEAQSFTVCGGHGLNWCGADGQTVKVMTARDGAILMGFPMTWQLPQGSRVAQRAVGNSTCVALAKSIVLAAMAVRGGEDSVKVVSEEPPPKHRRVIGVSQAKHRRLQRRIDDLERMVLELGSRHTKKTKTSNY